MQNDLRYTFRSQEIGYLMSMLRSGRLEISPYYQRNLVWRESHKKDFIDTILKGLPFPQIFVARGKIDIEKLESSTSVVDGQQRLNAIREFINDKLVVNGRLFSELTIEEKTEFVKYEVPVVDFDLDARDPRLKDVFKRLNRTFYSLSSIERIATEYSASEFMLTARALCGDIPDKNIADQELSAAVEILDDEMQANPDGHSFVNEFVRDPAIDDEKWRWLIDNGRGSFSELITSPNIFSPYEFQRKVPLMFCLNIMATLLGGYYNRNSRVKEYLEDYNSEFNSAAGLIHKLNHVAKMIRKMELPEDSMWWNKANFFTMVVEFSFLSYEYSFDAEASSKSLQLFSYDTPREYQLAAREGVNEKSERILRMRYFQKIVIPPIQQDFFDYLNSDNPNLFQ